LIINDCKKTRQKGRQNNRGQRLLEEFKNQTNMNVTFCNYKPARLYSADRDTSKEWYIIYSYLVPGTQDKYKQFKERFDMNRIPSTARRYEYGKAAERFMNQKLLEGFNPVSDLLGKKANKVEKKSGLDLADYLIQFSTDDFKKKTQSESIIQIHSNEIIGLMGETHTGKDFNYLIIAGIKTRSRSIYDVIFDAEGEPIQPGLLSDTVKKLAAFFEKKLQTGLIDEIPCLIHTVKK